jgi:hypothetical protein
MKKSNEKNVNYCYATMIDEKEKREQENIKSKREKNRNKTKTHEILLSHESF